MQIRNYENLLRSTLKKKISMMFYTDGKKNLKTTNVATMQFFNVETKATN